VMLIDVDSHSEEELHAARYRFLESFY
jgi:hypothetical protein